MGISDSLFIDGDNAYTTYGLAIKEGGYAGVVQWPALKAPNYIDWPEEDGIEPDLLSPCVEPKKEIRLDFFCVNAPAGINALMSVLQDEAYHDFYFKEIGVSVSLRFKEIVDRSRIEDLEVFSASFTCDENYLDSMTPDTSSESSADVTVTPFGMLVDSVDVSHWNIMPLEGTRETVTKASPLKDNIVISSKSISGQVYPDDSAVKSSREVTIPMLLRAVSPVQFWDLYLDFFATLIAPGGRILTFDGKTYDFYYVSQSVSEFSKLHDDSIWCRFDLTVNFYEGD